MQKKIGVIVDSFNLDLRRGIEKAREVGAEGVQMYAVSGEMDPDNLCVQSRKSLKSFINSNDLVVSAVCGDLGGHGFTNKEDNKWKIDKSKHIMDLAKDLETDIVTTHIGVIPEEDSSETYKIMQDACQELGEYADKVGGFFAIETGPENASLLRSFLDSLHTNGIAVNYDPANLVMVTGDDPVEGVYKLEGYIVHTHAKDGIMKKQGDPKEIYDFFAEGGIGDLRLEDFFEETPLGDGAVDFPSYIHALRDIGYDGYYTIEREVGDNPEEDIKKAVKYLKRLL